MSAATRLRKVGCGSVRRRGCQSASWTAAAPADPSGRAVEVIVVNLDQRLSAYRNACAHEGLLPDNAVLDVANGTLTCPWHGFATTPRPGSASVLPVPSSNNCRSGSTTAKSGCGSNSEGSSVSRYTVRHNISGVGTRPDVTPDVDRTGGWSPVHCGWAPPRPVGWRCRPPRRRWRGCTPRAGFSWVTTIWWSPTPEPPGTDLARHPRQRRTTRRRRPRPARTATPKVPLPAVVDPNGECTCPPGCWFTTAGWWWPTPGTTESCCGTAFRNTATSPRMWYWASHRPVRSPRTGAAGAQRRGFYWPFGLGACRRLLGNRHR